VGEKIAIVTGGAKRIGAAIVNALVEAGWTVFIHYRHSADEAKTLQNSLNEQSGREATFLVQADLTSRSDIQDLVQSVNLHPKVVENGISALIHNASLYTPMAFDELAVDDLRLYYMVHMEAPMLLTQGWLDSLRAANGTIIGITDTSWGRSWKHMTHYASTKAGLRQFLLNLAGELSPMPVNCIAPGAILAADWESEHFSNVVEKVPLQRGGQRSDIAQAVLFLINSPHISGHVLHVDGGWTINE